MSEEKRSPLFFAIALGLLIWFAALANAAHDLWAALLIYMAAAGLATAVFVQAAFQPRHPGVRTDLLKPVCGVLAVFGVSAFFGVNRGEALLEFLDWAAAALLFFVALNTFSTQRSWRLFLLLMVPLLCVEAVAVLQQKIHTGPAEYFTDIAPGTLVNASVGACFSVVWPPLFADQARRGLRFYWGTGLLAAALLLLFYMTTWAWVCLLLATPFFFNRNAVEKTIDRHKRVVWWGVGAAIVAIGVILAIKFGAARFFSNPNLPLIYTSRTSWWLSAVHMFLDHPLFGVGLGNFPSAYLAYKTGTGQHTFYAHGALFGFAAETGLAGLLALAVFLGALFKAVRRSTASLWALEGALLIYLAYVLIGVSHEYLINLMVPFILCGALVAFARPGRAYKPRPAVGLIVALVSLGLPLYLFPLFVASQKLVQGQMRLKEGRLEEAARSFQISAELNPLAFEPHQELARLSFARYASSMDPSFLKEAINQQKQALERNRLNVLLKKELAYYEKGTAGL